MLRTSISINSLTLTSFALITAGLLAFTFQSTKARIEAEERKAAQKALLEIIPLDQHDNDLLTDTQPVPPAALELLGLKKSKDIHIARQKGKPVAVIVPATAPDGYSGKIKLIVGINLDASLAGVRVLSHTETPGLGDKIDIKKSPWVSGFKGKSLTNPVPEKWKVRKDGGDFDQFTGATITPRAVVRQVRKALEFYSKHHESLLASPTVESTEVEQHTPTQASLDK